MGTKKRKPLRTVEKDEKGSVRGQKTARNVDDTLRNSSKAALNVKSDQTLKESSELEDGIEWERIERDQSKSDGKSERHNEQDNSSSDDDSDDDDDDDEINLDGSIVHDTEKYTFEFNDMREEYTEGICVLLRSLFQNPTEAYEFAKTISSQTLVGTVVACEGGADTFAFATVIPLTKEQLLRVDDPIGAMLRDLIQAVRKTSTTSAGSAAAETFLEFFTDSKICTTGVFVHKRFSNLPIQLVGPLHINLEQDVGWAQHNHESDDSEQNDFRSMQFVLLICACSPAEGCKLDQGQALNVLNNHTLLYEYFEDEIFAQSSIAAYMFKPKSSQSSVVVAVVPIASLKKCVNEICMLIPPADT